MNEDKKQPVEVADESLDQANGGLNFTMPTDQVPTDQQPNTYRGNSTITDGTLRAHAGGGGGGAGKVSMQDFH
ncbi:MAG TPA: hypothetical protein VEC11_11975 [Allosphingosinicella sp.]|nr:hypothetical protein [Allosphingosinicella sp.]